MELRAAISLSHDHRTESNSRLGATVASKTNPEICHMLTEEEILAAPEDDYMNDEQLAFFQRRLLDMRQSLVDSGENEQIGTLDHERAADESDRATQEEQYWIQVHMKERESNLIRDIDSALHRIRVGDYGFCDDTGEDIGIKRLLIRPTSIYTAEAQARRELQTRQYASA